jgi:hypothetical protein
MSGGDVPEDGSAGFLARWSRRKLAVPEAPAAADAAPPAAAEPPPAEALQTEPGRKPAAACPIPGGPEIDLASLPRLEDLTIATDLGPFLRPGVPAMLRDAALRRMWSLDPAIRDFINCVDYQWDFNTPGGLPPGFANELVGNVKQMLAQAIGLDDEGKSPADRAAEAEAEAQAEAAARSGAEAPPVKAEPAIAPPEPWSLPAIAEAPPTPEAVPASPGLPRRRHGAALPV